MTYGENTSGWSDFTLLREKNLYAFLQFDDTKDQKKKEESLEEMIVTQMVQKDLLNARQF